MEHGKNEEVALEAKEKYKELSTEKDENLKR